MERGLLSSDLMGSAVVRRELPGLVSPSLLQKTTSRNNFKYDKIIVIIDYLGFSNILGKIPSSTENGALN